MRVFITNNKKLAAMAGVTSQYLSAAKKTASISNSLAELLKKITGIEHDFWQKSSLIGELNSKLKSFFTNQLEKEKEFIEKTRPSR